MTLTTDPCLSVRFVQQLYRSWMGYAEQLSSEELDAIHVPTLLEERILDCLRRGVDVLLTGNPGDGKTHLIRRLQQLYGAELSHVQWVVDATAVEADGTAATAESTLYGAWVKARRAKRPSCIAINQGVLRELLKVIEDTALGKEVERQLDEGIWYLDHERPSSALASVVVVDLDHRALDRDFVTQAIANLTDDRFYPECSTCPIAAACPVPRNRARLRRPEVQERIALLIDLVDRSGTHVTIRDLMGLIAYMITAGLSCAEHMNSASTEARAYYNLAFSADNGLGRALRETFDPGLTTDPLVDDALWTGAFDIPGWDDASELREPPTAMSQTSDARTRMNSFRRLHFFEFVAGDDLMAYLRRHLSRSDAEFFDILRTGTSRSADTTRRLVGLINGFFSRLAGSGELRIWNRHHFDVPPSRVYISTRGVSARQMGLALPKPAEWQEIAAPLHVDHFMLVAFNTERTDALARLRVDRDTYRGLADAASGQPFALRRGDLIKALERFMAVLTTALRKDPSLVDDVLVESFKTGRSYHFTVSRESRTYSG